MEVDYHYCNAKWKHIYGRYAKWLKQAVCKTVTLETL